MFNKLRANYSLSNVLIRILFVLTFVFCNWQEFLGVVVKYERRFRVRRCGFQRQCKIVFGAYVGGAFGHDFDVRSTFACQFVFKRSQNLQRSARRILSFSSFILFDRIFDLRSVELDKSVYARIAGLGRRDISVCGCGGMQFRVL